MRKLTNHPVTILYSMSRNTQREAGKGAQTSKTASGSAAHPSTTVPAATGKAVQPSSTMPMAAGKTAKPSSTPTASQTAKQSSTVPGAGGKTAQPSSTIQVATGKIAQPSGTVPAAAGKATQPSSTVAGKAVQPSSITPTSAVKAAQPSSTSMPAATGKTAQPSSTVPAAAGKVTQPSSTVPAATGKTAQPSSTVPVAGGKATQPSSTVPVAAGKAVQPNSTTTTNAPSPVSAVKATMQPSKAMLGAAGKATQPSKTVPGATGKAPQPSNNGIGSQRQRPQADGPQLVDVWALRDHFVECKKMKNGGRRLMDMFKMMDRDKSGVLTMTEFGTAMKKMGFASATQEQVEAVFKILDADQGGSVKYNELDGVMMRLGERPKPEDLSEPPPPLPSPPRVYPPHFPKAIDPDARFAQPTFAQNTALELGNWKFNRDTKRRTSTSPSAERSESDQEAWNSLQATLARTKRDDRLFERGLPATDPSVQAANTQPWLDLISDMSQRLRFKPSLEQGSYSSLVAARKVMMEAGHHCSLHKRAGRRLERTRHEITLQCNAEERIGFRINNSNEVTVVHPETAASAADLRVGDLIIFIDGHSCSYSGAAVSWWSKLEGKAQHELSVVRSVERPPTPRPSRADHIKESEAEFIKRRYLVRSAPPRSAQYARAVAPRARRLELVPEPDPIPEHIRYHVSLRG